MGGLVLVRELDERLGFEELIERRLADVRGKNIQLTLADLLQQSVYRPEGRLRRPQRRRVAVAGSDHSADRLEEDLETWHCADLALAVV
jgi:hypothetical protein